jgi:phosphoribosylformylglycinamidine (FGAM) synthase-like enzyme
LPLLGHSPVAALLDPVAGSRTAIAEALSNIVWAIKGGTEQDIVWHAAVAVQFTINWDQYSNRKRLPFDETEIPE